MQSENDQYLYEERNDTQDVFILKRHPHASFYTHFHSALELYYVIDGKIRARINGEDVIAEKGEITICNPFETHTYYWIEPAEVFVFIVNNKYLDDYKSYYAGEHFKHLLTDKEYNKTIYNIFSSIPPSFQNNTTLSPLRKIAYTNLIFSLIIDKYGTLPERKNTNLANRILIFIFENHKKEITLESCAKHFNYAKNSFSRLFSQYIGIDFRTFLNNVRAESANLMLSSPETQNMTTLEIAIACGFNSEATFYRAYKRRYQSLPKRK